MTKYLWQILVPSHYNNRQEIPLSHHKVWDKFVEDLAGGLTIKKTSRGVWINNLKHRFEEKMIPVEIICSAKEIATIADFSAKHYRQEAILYYKISSLVKIIQYDKDFNRIIT